jgi:Family of unknown function (DUF6152)
MIKHLPSCLAAFVVTLALAGAAAAHHSFAMFDMDKNVELQGRVIDYKWANPHVHVMIQVPPGQGVDPSLVGAWDLEAAGSTTIMGRQGWRRDTLKPGDQIRVVVHPLRDGNKGASLFYMIKPDGTRLYTDIARPKEN